MTVIGKADRICVYGLEFLCSDGKWGRSCFHFSTVAEAEAHAIKNGHGRAYRVMHGQKIVKRGTV